MDEFEKYAYEIKHNRDYYSRAKIIEMLCEKHSELESKRKSNSDRVAGYKDFWREKRK